MFEKIREEINRHECEQLAKTENALHNMTASAILDSWYYRGLCTPKVFEAVKALNAGEKLGDDLIAKMMKKRARKRPTQCGTGSQTTTSVTGITSISAKPIPTTAMWLLRFRKSRDTSKFKLTRGLKHSPTTLKE